jgi:hypothetical protein
LFKFFVNLVLRRLPPMTVTCMPVTE